MSLICLAVLVVFEAEFCRYLISGISASYYLLHVSSIQNTVRSMSASVNAPKNEKNIIEAESIVESCCYQSAGGGGGGTGGGGCRGAAG